MATLAALQRPQRHDHQKICVFIDASNVFHATQQCEMHIDFQKFIIRIANGRLISKALFYTGVDKDNFAQLGFFSRLQHIGYTVVSDQIVRRADGSWKANLDVKIALDMVELVNTYDTAILVSGDGDLKWAVEKVQSYGKQVVVVGLGSMTSYQLRALADDYIDLIEIEDEISK